METGKGGGVALCTGVRDSTDYRDKKCKAM